MEIILKQDIAQLGNKGAMITVKNGYGRNYLIPKGWAVLATKSAKKVFAENQKQKTAKDEKLKNEALKLVADLKKVTFKIITKASSKGKIFGSVKSIQIAEEMAKQGFQIDRKKIIIKDPIKELGKYKASVELHKDIKIEVNLEVIEE